ncbi:MAG: branched-chain amino acid ABC transporter permease, partial [Proteobacteria bacterium]|nr:branched-chain amino acid ABC transporter permease [Pseudomonadota bacterium]
PAMIDAEMVNLGAISLRPDLIVVFAVSVVATIALLTLLYRTRLGLATRAVAQQPVAAQLCGIRVVRVNAVTFVITGLLGGIAGALVCSAVGALSILITGPLTVKGLIVTVIGGLGSVPGAIIAGLLVGGLENLFLHFRGVTERDLYVMLLLFAFLIFRPGGIFAKGGGRD